MAVHAGQPANEIVVDARGHAYVNGADFDFVADAPPKPGYIKLVTPDGHVRQVADDIQFPNGMVITPDGRTLIISESFAWLSDRVRHRRRRRAFGAAGVRRRSCAGRHLHGRRGRGVGGHGRVLGRRVAEGGQVRQRVELGENRASFAMMLGGPDRRTLFICTVEWRQADDHVANLERLATGPRTGTILALPVEVPGTGRPLAIYFDLGCELGGGRCVAVAAVAAESGERLPGCGVERFGMGPAVVLGQDLTEVAGPVRDGALADLAAGDRQLGNGHREVAGR